MSLKFYILTLIETFGLAKETPISITTLKSAEEDIEEKSDEINQRRKLVWEHPSESIYIGKFGKIVKKEYGKSRNDDNTEEKTILIYGPDESHTNAVIDGIMNFIFGVSAEDDYRFSLENDEKTSVTILKVFPTDKSRILYTLNIVGVNSTIAIENVDILTTDLESHEITSLNSFCFVMKDLIPLTCGKNLAKFVNVFNTCVDNAQGFHDPKVCFQSQFTIRE
ncbi:unnamed protein product [Mytilus edulis]|uniref:Uncharacterized protein n=1 Tax=Mytilus edulis TaxID=6550 RepID=A0A8S3S970_MYTED|nr:unnamed protein product [Mytilus edulis]